MFDSVLNSLGDLMGSPWIYVLLAGLSFLDAVVPVFPSEAPLIMAGVYAGSTGEPNVALAVLSAGVGALLGDHATYLLGRAAADRLDRIPATTRTGRILAGARSLADKRGGTALIVARFIPWGRIATTLTFGAIRYPRRKFTAFDVIGVTIWAMHGTLLGYIGGAAFQNQPTKGLLLGIGLALLASVLIEGGRWLWHRRRSSEPVTDERRERAEV
ncbi:DedA family protein [Calidifontibacter sp. DB0510]|uniref:DedA family protein n=1 Tax=Metallococcus carri TaxID=1656884 RepID=A0A967B5C9_9MICO|nr:DedA family protein [Metallococcus carri]NHN55917.1 DedA family protein [Metallococcus carri]NOP38395.1 DedA family protein [Calidifontibacter sp. DB2511S]